MVEALARLKGQPFHMYFVGTGYAADDLRRLVADCGLDGQVTFAGAVTDREVMRRYYAAADLFLFPSLYDNAPLVVREAAALGVPSVMVAGSTAAEILTDGVDGFLVQNTPESLSGEILRLMQHPDLVRQAGDEARRTPGPLVAQHRAGRGARPLPQLDTEERIMSSSPEAGSLISF